MSRRGWVLLFSLPLALLLGASGVVAGPDRSASLRPLQAVVGTAFTYQGHLLDGGSPADGSYDFCFELYDAASSGNYKGTDCPEGVSVSNGVFTVQLDFGSQAFTGEARWLQIYVRPQGGGSYTMLSPRQALTPTPYAINADTLDGEDASSFLSVSGGSLSGDLTVSGTLRAVYGGGKSSGGSSYNEIFKVGSLPYSSVSTYEKMLVMVWGGTWFNNTLGQDVFAISSRGGLKITRTRLYGATSNAVLKVYDNGSNYDVVVEVGTSSFPGVVIRSFMTDSSDGFHEMPVTAGYSTAGNSNVTPTIENHIIVDNNGRVGIGKTNPQNKLDVAGTTRTHVLNITGGSDLAEPFAITNPGAVEPGMVVSIDSLHPGRLRVADQAYDQGVVGCVSGANDLQPGLVMHQEGASAEAGIPVALTGRVYCLADASYGEIRPGDLLTTSGTPGHAMRASDPNLATGAVLGKAMSGMAEGRGWVLVLVSLQ